MRYGSAKEMTLPVDLEIGPLQSNAPSGTSRSADGNVG